MNRCMNRNTSRHQLTHAPSSLLDRIRIERGTIADYEAMAQWHYRTSRPTSIVLVLVAYIDPPHTATPTPIAVQVVTMPSLNGRWRRYAWPGRYTTRDKAADVRRLNREVRTLARAIVDPRARALGVATRLVQTYLQEPLTPNTEAVSAMGAFTSFLVAAGMTEYVLPPTPAQARFADYLDSLGVTSATLLADRALRRDIGRMASTHLEIAHLHANAGGRRFEGAADPDQCLIDSCLYVHGTRTAYAHTCARRSREHHTHFGGTP